MRGVAKIVNNAFGIKISYETIRQLVLTSEHSIKENAVSSKTWHADETYIKIKGKGFWVWVVRCKESGHVIAWNITKTHLLKDAKKVMKNALEQSKGIKPEKIITDGLWQYPVAIYKTMLWSWKEQKEKHIIDSGIGKNYFIERLNREIKRRLKWFSTFQALDSAKAFFGLWFYHFNSLSPAT